MPSAELNITVVQPDIVWEDKDANLRMYEGLIVGVQEKKEVIALPEMFSTGFSMAPEKLAELMDGATVQWMKDIAKKHRCILTGSAIIEDNGQYYNRLLWVQPDGQLGYYDKRHLFAYANEDQHYSPGSKKLITQVKGFRICPLVCYDLRFPAWSRNQGDEYDVLLYVANWPERRSLAWKTLLQARAIENQCYVVGVNRVGKDGKDINYSGDSSIFDPMGEMLWRSSNEVVTQTITLSKDRITEVRNQLPFLKDADKIMILD